MKKKEKKKKEEKQQNKTKQKQPSVYLEKDTHTQKHSLLYI